MMDVISSIQGVVWGPVMLVLLFGTHVFLTLRTRVIQRYVFKGIKLSVTPDKEASGDVSGFGALATALAATIGTGNIVGVATAIASGGPGAVFWVWLTGCFGMASKYGEAILAIKYRVKGKDGGLIGGPMYALERGLKQKWLGILFALFAGCACFGIGNGTQGNSISSMVQDTFGVSPYITGVVLTILTGIVIIGGVKSIARVCEKLVPFMAGFYIIGALVLIIMNIGNLPNVIRMIFVGAFNPEAAIGGFAGVAVSQAIKYGVARGLFSNEAGMGSTPHAHAVAKVKHPCDQGLVAMMGVFIDTLIILNLTAFAVMITGQLNTYNQDLTGTALTQAAFTAGFGKFGAIFIAICMFFFAFSTIIGWGLYGSRFIAFLCRSDKVVRPFFVVYSFVSILGSTMDLGLMWSIADTFNGLMSIPNLVALLLLSGTVAQLTKEYFEKEKV